MESSSDTDESIDQQEEVVDCEEVDDLRIEDEPTRYIVMYLKKLREMPNFELNLLAATLEIVAEAEQSEDDVLMEVMKCKLRTCSIKILKEITSNCGIDCSTCVEKSDVIQEIVSYLIKAKYLPFSDEKNNLKRRFSEKVGNNTENINVKSRRPIDKKIFEGIEVIVAENLPFDIDNDTIYQLPIKTKDGKQLTPEDGRPFGKPVTCQTREFPGNRRRMQNCKGSHTCDNVNCNYLLEFGIENKVYFKNGKCKICSNEGIVMPCFARKLIEFGTEFVRVYHTGQHTCKAIPRQEMPAEVIELIRLHRRVKPRQVQRNIVLSAIEKGTMSKEELLGLTKNLNNKTKIENTKKKMKSKYRPEGHSFDALATFREKALKWDPFYIFEINNGKLNDKPSYVFKMSVATAKIALDMDKDRDSYLSEEWTFFDGTFKRCPGFVTLGAEMFHPLADRIIKLACMETDKEDTASIALFWRLFNRVLQQYSGNPEYKFNPSGLLCDELGSNWLGAESEFGPSIKNRSKFCAFHFKETIKNHSAKLSTEAEKNEFRRLGNEWLESATKSEYWKCFDNLMEFASMSDSRRKAVSYWVEWWHKRRSHLFKPFCPLYHAPRCNIGESQHAKYKMMDGVQLTLLDAAQDDIAEFLETEDLLKGLEDGTTPFTSTATSSATREKEYREQQARARAYGEDLRQRKDIPRESCSQSFVGDPTSTHRPDKHRNSRNRPAEDDDDNNIPHKKTRKSQEKRESVWRNTRSQVFEKSLHKAKTENIKLRSQEKRENERARKYVITNAKMDYHVVIGNNPSCSCPFQVRILSEIKTFSWNLKIFQQNSNCLIAFHSVLS